MKPSKVIYIVIIFLSLFFGSCCNHTDKASKPVILKEAPPESAGVSSERLARLDRLIQSAVDSGWTAGAVGFVARNGKIVYHKALGVSDLDNKTPLKKDDIFRIASQTKAIVSIAAMMLFEEGKFLLDDPVSKYIPEFKNPRVLDKFNPADTTFTTVPARREITIRDLFTHTSGIDYAGIGSPVMRAIYAKYDIPAAFGTDKMVLGDNMRALGKLPLAHQPGERFTYGLNIDLLGYLVEIWSGENLDEYLRKHIFEPLGMNDTYFYLPEDKHSRLVKVNTEGPDGKVKSMPQDMVNYPLLKGTYFSGGAGLSSTVYDYAVFLQMLLNNGEYNGQKLLSRRTVELITSNQIGDLNLGYDKFGLGFQITTERGQTVLGVSEGSFSWGGYFGTTYWADPKERIVGLLFMQQVPLSHGGEIQGKFKALVYQALND